MDEKRNSERLTSYRLDLIKAMSLASQCSDRIERGEALPMAEVRLLLFAFQLLLEPLQKVGSETLEAGLLGLRMALESTLHEGDSHLTLCHRLRNLNTEIQSLLRNEVELNAVAALASDRAVKSIATGHAILTALELTPRPAA